MRDKTKVALKGVVVALVIITLLALCGTLWAKGKTGQAIIGFAIAVVAFVLFIPFLIKRYRDVKEGFPHEDERSKKVKIYAAAKAYFISVWWLLGIMWYNFLAPDFFGVPELMARHVITAGILGMAAIFGLCWLWYSRKGDIE